MTTLGTTPEPHDGPAGDYSDRPRALRAEDAFDVVAAHAWLREHVAGLPADPPEVQQFPGGASNLTYLLTYRSPIDVEGSPSTARSLSEVEGRSLILRRPPSGTKAATAHDMAREFTIQQRLRPTFPQVPEVLALCTDPAVIGSDFYVMERMPGIILRGDLPPGLEFSADQAAHLSQAMVDTIVALHAVDPAAAGLSDIGRGPGYVGRQVAGWSRRYRAARTENVPDFESVMAWLDAEQPHDVGYCVVHGDFRLDNLVLDPDVGYTIKALLDWELATLGDPLMDLGSAMAYWVQADDDFGMQMARRQPTNLPGMITRREFVERYCAATGLDAGNWAFYEVFGLFRIAVIAQQIYYRFHHGQTTNPAFANFWRFVEYAEQRCRSIAGPAEDTSQLP